MMSREIKKAPCFASRRWVSRKSAPWVATRRLIGGGADAGLRSLSGPEVEREASLSIGWANGWEDGWQDEYGARSSDECEYAWSEGRCAPRPCDDPGLRDGEGVGCLNGEGVTTRI